MLPEVSWLAQIPLVAIFIWFTLAIRREQSVGIKENHAEWQKWLTERDAKFIEQLQALQAFQDKRQADFQRELNGIIRSLDAVQGSLSSLINLMLVVYSEIGGLGALQEVSKFKKEI